MRRGHSSALVIVVGAAWLATALILLLLPTGRASAAQQGTSPAAPHTNTLTATVYLTPSASSVVVGRSVSVTAQVVTTGTCRFPIYDVTLGQDPAFLFAHTDPPTSVIRAPGSTAVYTLTAVQTGTVTFTVEFYGEVQCGGVYTWHYENGQSAPVRVTGSRSVLPFVAKYCGLAPPKEQHRHD